MTHGRVLELDAFQIVDGMHPRVAGSGANIFDHTIYRLMRELVILDIAYNKLFQLYLHQWIMNVWLTTNDENG